MKNFIALLFLFSLATLPTVVAQETTPQPTPSWTLERSCVPLSARRPDGWTFDGTILLTGYAGIHGVNDDWSTPRVVTPLNFVQTNTDLVGGSLSPDGRWYASPFGDRLLTQSNNVFTTVREIHVYSTSDDFEYKVILEPAIEDIPQGFYIQIYWQDSQWFLYANGERDMLINPFTQETKLLGGYHFNMVYDRFDDLQRPHIAPDFTLAVSTHYPSNEPWSLYAAPADDLFTDKPLAQLHLAATTIVAWRPDSQIFAAEQVIESGRQLVFINRNGAIDEIVFNLPKGERIGNNNTAWSLNGRYFAFITFKDLGSEHGYYDYWESPNTLYIVDTQKQVVIDTCSSTGIGLAWSPSSTQLAFLASGEGTQPVFVLDVENLKAYAVANYLVEGIGVGENSRPDSVIGWRTNWDDNLI